MEEKGSYDKESEGKERQIKVVKGEGRRGG
jgi:hypothetical protein